MIKLTYIWHDCFIAETADCSVIFDYWQEPDSTECKFLDMIDKNKPFYVVVSHHHKDHFNPVIFEWSRLFPKIEYILSGDTARFARHYIKADSLYKGVRRVNPEQVHVLKEGDSFADGMIDITAYGSTDTGNSYLVQMDGKRVFHAGDLNAWIWKDESTQAEVDAAVSNFKKKLEPLRERFPVIDIAMFPVDPRLGTDFWEGASIFVRMFDVKHFVPMHFCLGKDLDQQISFQNEAVDFKNYANPQRGEYHAMILPYTSITVK